MRLCVALCGQVGPEGLTPAADTYWRAEPARGYELGLNETGWVGARALAEQVEHVFGIPDIIYAARTKAACETAGMVGDWLMRSATRSPGCDQGIRSIMVLDELRPCGVEALAEASGINKALLPYIKPVLEVETTGEAAERASSVYNQLRTAPGGSALLIVAPEVAPPDMGVTLLPGRPFAPMRGNEILFISEDLSDGSQPLA